MNWVPDDADAEQATRHLNARIPKAHKKGVDVLLSLFSSRDFRTDCFLCELQLHFLLIRHGQACRLCAANGKLVPQRFDPHLDIAADDCPLREYHKKKSARK